MADLFWAKVRKTENCWIWEGGYETDGDYGYFDINGKRARAHRVAYELTYGAIADGLFACHRCDNPSCVRPDHLFLGTNQENMDDCAAKGRLAHIAGTQILHGGKKLTDEQVAEIVQIAKEGSMSQEQMSLKYGVSRSFISMLASGKRRRSAISK